MKLILVIFTTAVWVAAATMSAAEAQTIEQEGSGNAVTILQSEAEIWEFLEKLCVEAPTQRCESMQFMRVRDGESVTMEPYNEEEAYHGKDELIEAARATRAEQPLSENG